MKRRNGERERPSNMDEGAGIAESNQAYCCSIDRDKFTIIVIITAISPLISPILFVYGVILLYFQPMPFVHSKGISPPTIHATSEFVLRFCVRFSLPRHMFAPYLQPQFVHIFFSFFSRNRTQKA